MVEVIRDVVIIIIELVIAIILIIMVVILIIIVIMIIIVVVVVIMMLRRGRAPRFYALDSCLACASRMYKPVPTVHPSLMKYNSDSRS